MKSFFKSKNLLLLSTYLYLLFFTIGGETITTKASAGSYPDIPEFVLENGSDANSSATVKKTAEPFSLDLLRFKKCPAYVTRTDKENRDARSYFLHNTYIHFNSPHICYKFPLSEHTEEG